MLELASLGAQVLNNRSVELAKKYNVDVYKRQGLVARDQTQAHPIRKGSDDTLFALVDGTVRFERVGKTGKKCSVKQ